MRTVLQHWRALWQRLGAQGDGGSEHDKLVIAYSQPWRHYHNLRHLEECLTALDQARIANHVSNADAVETALWFHDAVCDPKAGDNEERSAAQAREALEAASVDPSLIAVVTRLVLCTKTHSSDGQEDARWMIDIDLSILGRDQDRFNEYETQIRAEYAWVPAEIYNEKRAEILAGFLARDRLFATEYFHLRYEAPARLNLAKLTNRLRHGSA